MPGTRNQTNHSVLVKSWLLEGGLRSGYLLTHNFFLAHDITEGLNTDSHLLKPSWMDGINCPNKCNCFHITRLK